MAHELLESHREAASFRATSRTSASSRPLWNAATGEKCPSPIYPRARHEYPAASTAPPDDAAAERIDGFVTRGGTSPAEFRRFARERLGPYADVEVRHAALESVARRN